MYHDLELSIEGVAPLLMHNGQLANPLNKWAKAMKSITKKGQRKTDADLEELARLEFMGGLYVDDDGNPCIPGTNIEGVLVEGAKKQRQGDKFKAGVWSEGNWKLIYTGSKDPNKLWEDENFRDIRPARVKNNTVMRCRPIFRAWALKFKVTYNDQHVNADEVLESLAIGGRDCGLCDYTPKFGRFEVK